MNEEIKRKRIRVVDDESNLTLFYRMSLGYLGFEVETFNDPKMLCQISKQLIMT